MINAPRIINIVCLAIMLAIQAFCFSIVYTGGRGVQGNIRLDLGGIMLFVFLFSIRHYSQVLNFLVPNALWTIGIYLVFQDSIISVAGAMLMLGAVWNYSLIGPQRK